MLAWISGDRPSSRRQQSLPVGCAFINVAGYSRPGSSSPLLSRRSSKPSRLFQLALLLLRYAYHNLRQESAGRLVRGRQIGYGLDLAHI
jgi:hypothetical protein